MCIGDIYGHLRSCVSRSEIRLSERLEWLCNSTLGMQSFDQGGKTIAFRMDDRIQRLVVSYEPGESLASIAWEVSDRSDFEAFCPQLESAGFEVNTDDRALCDRLFIEDLLSFYDAAGNCIELVYGPYVRGDPFVARRAIKGFKKSPYGMNHAELHVSHPTPLANFYRHKLEFFISDYGLDPVPVYLFHVNGRHNSLAIVRSKKSGFYHLMVEYQSLDDIKQRHNIAKQMDDAISYSLDRDTNDYMKSFNAKSPSGFFVKNGWGGRIINPTTQKPHETNVGPSFWGNESLYLSEDERNAFRQMHTRSAHEGKRSLPVVDCVWLYNEFLKKPNE